jgi:Putative zinc-finger
MRRFTSDSSMLQAGGQLCARARFWVSLRVDDELSELEGALLDAHLARCADCAEFATAATVSTAWLRDTRLQWPAAPVRVAAPKSSRGSVAGLAAAAALLVSAVVAGIVVHGTVWTHGDASALKPTVSVVSSSETPDELRRLRRTSLLNQRPVPREFSTEPA